MTTNSPTRKSFLTHKRDSYAYNKESTVNRYPNHSQKSPLINSPNLNEEVEYDNIKNENAYDLKNKLDILLKNNSQLLNENALLS
jgi:hypothetical protein